MKSIWTLEYDLCHVILCDEGIFPKCFAKTVCRNSVRVLEAVHMFLLTAIKTLTKLCVRRVLC